MGKNRDSKTWIIDLWLIVRNPVKDIFWSLFFCLWVIIFPPIFINLVVFSFSWHPLRKIILYCLFRLTKEFDRQGKDLESRNDPDTNKMLNEKKQSMVCSYLYFYLAFRYFINFCQNFSFVSVDQILHSKCIERFSYSMQIKELNSYVVLQKQ